MPESAPLLCTKRLGGLLKYCPEAGLLTWKSRGHKVWDSRYAGKPALAYASATGYLCGTIDGRSYKAHRVAWAIHYGYWPQEIDHINGRRDDNRICNLREVDRATNSRNRCLRSDNPTGHVGVTPTRYGKWRARIHVDGRELNLGVFDTIEAASKARQLASTKHDYTSRHGEANHG